MRRRPPSDPEQLGARVAVSARWVAGSTVVASLSTWATYLVLARLLDRHTFGLAALALLAVAVFQLFQDSGLHAALIQRRDGISAAADAAMLYAPLTGLLLGALCFGAAPLAAHFFHQPEVRGLVEGMAGVFVLRSFAVVPTALIQRELRFDRMAVVSGGGSLLYFGSTVTLAAAGAGAWSVIGGQLVVAAWAGSVSWLLAPWRPDPRRGTRRELRQLLRYGRHIVAGNVVGFVNSNTDPVGVGRLYGPPGIGAYTIGFQTGSQAVTFVTAIANQLVFPAYAKLQDDLARFRSAYLRSLRFLCTLSPPVAFGLAAVSGVAIPALYGAKWGSAVPVLTIISFYGLFLSVSATTGEVFKAAGRPDLFFRMGVFQVVLLFALIGALYSFGITGFALARTGATFVMSVVALVVAGRILGLRLVEWARALAAPFEAAAAMGAIVYGTRLALQAVYGTRSWQLAPLVVEGALLYPLALRLLARERWEEFVAELERIVPLQAAVRRLRRGSTVVQGDLDDPRVAAGTRTPRLAGDEPFPAAHERQEARSR